MQKQTRRARSRHGCGLLPVVTPRSHSSTRMRLLFAARTGGFFSLGVQDSTGTPAILSSRTLAAFVGTDKRRKVIKIPPQRLETLTAIFRYGCLCSLLYLLKHACPLTETLANVNTADRWQTATKNELADLPAVFISTNWEVWHSDNLYANICSVNTRLPPRGKIQYTSTRF
jgi:hypothetical protein